MNGGGGVEVEGEEDEKQSKWTVRERGRDWAMVPLTNRPTRMSEGEVNGVVWTK